MLVIDRLPDFAVLQKSAISGGVAPDKLTGVEKLYAKITADPFLSALALEGANRMLCGDFPEKINSKLLLPEEKGVFFFILILLAHPAARRIFMEREIPVEYFDTVWRDLHRWSDFYFAAYGEMRFSNGVAKWYTKHLAGKLFEFGRVQFELPCFALYDFDCSLYLEKGEAFINMHIPAGGRLDVAQVEKSLHDLVLFAGKYFPEYNFKNVCCYSWLWDNALDDLLPANSNIKAVKALGNTVQTRIPSDIIWRLFGEEKTPTPKTSLQKAVLDAQDRGVKFNYALLVIPIAKYQR